VAHDAIAMHARGSRFSIHALLMQCDVCMIKFNKKKQVQQVTSVQCK
jgi:hypothetical protein